MFSIYFKKFWQEHSALYFGLWFLIGTSLTGSNYALLPAILPLLLQTFSRILLGILFAFAAALYRTHLIVLPLVAPEGIVGSANITVETITDQQNAFGKGWIYSGKLHSFLVDGQKKSVAKNIPIKIFVKKGRSERPSGNFAYMITAVRLKQIKQREAYILKTSASSSWFPTYRSYSLSEPRRYIKRYLKKYIEQRVKQPRSANLLTGVITGEFSDQQTRSALSRFGLQHILAVSGLHFGIIVSTLSLSLRLLFKRSCSLPLLIAITGYFALVGSSPSVTRAYIAASIFLLGQWTKRPARAVNSLGVSLIAILIYDPLSYLSPAFQLSFTATAAILLLYQPVDYFLKRLLLRHSKEVICHMSFTQQHAILLLIITRKALALSLAVHLLTIPLCLYYFQKFPLWSLIFNLFFPFLITIAMILFLISALTKVPLFSLSGYLLERAIDLTYNFPLSWDLYLRISQPYPWIVVSLATLLFSFAILQRSKREIAFVV